MNQVTEYFRQAELSLAAYANLTTGEPNQTELIKAGLSSTQASAFVSTWRVIDQYSPVSSGLSATVFEEVSSGKRYLAIRGTENSPDFVTDLIDIALLGTPAIQVQYADLKAKVGAWRSNGTLPTSFTVTGHSLGGFLATALTADFALNITQTYLYNSPGLNGVLGSATAAILEAFGITAPIDASKVINIKADAGISPIAGLGAQVSPVISIAIAIENQFLSDVPNPPLALNHSQRVLADALALYAAYAQVDPTAGVTSITNIIKASTNLNGNTLELALDNLRALIFGDTVPGTVPEDRENYYTHLQELGDWLDTHTGPALKLDALTAFDGATIATKALQATPEGLAYRYAVAHLLPFAVTGDASLYAQHNAHGELDRYDPTTGQGYLGDLYLQDRAAMLSWKIKYDMGALDADDALTRAEGVDKPYTQDWDTWSIAGDWDFIDHSTGITLSIDGQGPNTLQSDPNHQIVFGSDNAETLVGGETSDHLYGNGGNDTLNGGNGADHIEGNLGDDTLYGGNGNDTLLGGQGFDTYRLFANEGLDTLQDADGQGQIFLDNALLEGGNRLGGNLWQSADKHHSYRLVGDTLSIGTNLRIEGFQDGDLGIHLGDAPITPPTPSQTITGDLAPLDQDLATAGVQLGYDALGNVLVAATPAPGREDTLLGSAGNDLLQGLGGGDLLDAGAGDDSATGNAGSDVVWGGAGDDTLHGGDAQALATALATGETQAATGARGDLLDGGDGDDTLIGAAGDDTLNGGMGGDLLIGGGGDDNLQGDERLDWADRDWQVTRSIFTGLDGSTNYQRTYSHAGGSGSAAGGDDLLFGSAGADWLLGGQGGDLLDGGSGNDLLFGEAGNDTLLGQDGDDELIGDTASLAEALHGNDLLDGGAGTLLGGSGDDRLFGNVDGSANQADGNDWLDGGTGDDRLDGGTGADTLRRRSGAVARRTARKGKDYYFRRIERAKRTA